MIYIESIYIINISLRKTRFIIYSDLSELWVVQDNARTYEISLYKFRLRKEQRQLVFELRWYRGHSPSAKGFFSWRSPWS